MNLEFDPNIPERGAEDNNQFINVNDWNLEGDLSTAAGLTDGDNEKDDYDGIQGNDQREQPPYDDF